jgi:integrase
MTALVLREVRPELAQLQKLVLDAVSSPVTKAQYARALGDFFRWREEQGGPAFTRAAVQAHRAALEARGLSPSSINQRLAAIKKLAREAAANGLLDAETNAAIHQVPGVRQAGTRAGNWLTRAQAAALLNAPDDSTLKGSRDRALLALLLGCGLRRSEACAVTLEQIQQRDGRWVIADLRGKHGRIRTVPVPGWVKQAIDGWCMAAAITAGRLLRAVNRHGQVMRESVSPQAILDIVALYAGERGLQIKPHDLRRTCAKLCRAGGGELEQIQLLLGHASIQTTERYLGTRQNLADAPNDRLGIGWGRRRAHGHIEPGHE